MKQISLTLLIIGTYIASPTISGCAKDNIPRNFKGETPKEQAHREMEERTGLKIGESPGAAYAKRQDALWKLYTEDRKTMLSRTSYQVYDRNVKNNDARVTYLEMNYNLRDVFSSMRLMRDSLKWDGQGWQVASSHQIENKQPWSSNLEAISKKIRPAQLIGLSPKQIAVVLGKSKRYRHVGGGRTIPADECTYAPLPKTIVTVWYGNKKANRIAITFSAGKTLPNISPMDVAKAFGVEKDTKKDTPISFVGVPRTPLTNISLRLRYFGTYPFYTISFGTPEAHYS